MLLNKIKVVHNLELGVIFLSFMGVAAIKETFGSPTEVNGCSHENWLFVETLWKWWTDGGTTGILVYMYIKLTSELLAHL